MPKRSKSHPTLADILQSLSEEFCLDPLGNASVAIDSRRADSDTPLHVLTRGRNHYALRLLIEAGADVNAVGDMSETPLHIALRKEDFTSASLLIEADANPHLVSEFGQSPLDIAKGLGGRFLRLLAKR